MRQKQGVPANPCSDFRFLSRINGGRCLKPRTLGCGLLCSNGYPEHTETSEIESKDQSRLGRLLPVTPVDRDTGLGKKSSEGHKRDGARVVGGEGCWTRVCSLQPEYGLGRTELFTSL